jgi:hypothetical protein
MRRLTHTLIWLPGLLLAWSVASAVEPAADAQAAPPEPPAAPPPAESSRPDPLRDYIEQARAQRRAQIERLRAESRDESERARQQRREAVQEESRLHREQLERWWEPKPPDGPPPGDWSNPWYYRGW